MTTTRLVPLAMLALGVFAAACNSGPAPTPSAPTTVTSPSDARTGDAARPGSVQISGTVSRVTGTCPALRFLVGRVIVDTSRATVFNGGRCAAVVTGTGVVATGTRSGEGTLAATSITFRGTTTRSR